MLSDISLLISSLLALAPIFLIASEAFASALRSSLFSRNSLKSLFLSSGVPGGVYAGGFSWRNGLLLRVIFGRFAASRSSWASRNALTS